MAEHKKPTKCEPTELRNWPIFFTSKEREEIVRYAERIRSSASRPPRDSELGNVLAQTVLDLLHGVERLGQDVAGTRTRIDDVKAKREEG